MTPKTFKSDNARITAYLDGPMHHGATCATVGNFAFKSPDAGAEILGQAIAHIRENGIRQIIGPMDGDTWHSYRIVTQTDSSPAFLLEPGHLPGAVDIFKAAGFTTISRYFSARASLADAAKIKPDPTDNFRIERWDGNDPQALFDQVYDLSTQAFARNMFYKPISRAAFLDIYMPMVPMLKPELIFFARRPDGSLAGFLFGTPDYAQGPKPTSVILKTYASLERGAGQHLAFAFHTAAAAQGYETAIHALIHDDNQSAARSASEGADIFRRYDLFGLTLDG
ncbi:hypothetical protein [Yoonia sediminilitoris]|uniref:N-acetyltransferase domain-containing protein n=1 Tax=Yoonia sediminilitoris TaxID=1286148 RepID=A0A2T6K681_9RHOB|nr:hypothetical protein [Yoonia sediminilitoris]PUB10169.1 hypothetical protein C8N45_12125 [Yoonia sediminilitoris]RCW89691.1 hypothetical protein DFP92_12125 [Yoonia sediminilitoris]